MMSTISDLELETSVRRHHDCRGAACHGIRVPVLLLLVLAVGEVLLDAGHRPMTAPTLVRGSAAPARPSASRTIAWA